MKKLTLILLVAGLVMLMTLPASAQRKLRYGGAVKTFPPYLLPALVAQEKGFWKQNGLEVEITLFATGVPLSQAMATGHIDIGALTSGTVMQAMAGGAPLVIISDLVTQGAGYDLYVGVDSPVKEVQELKGSKISVGQLGTASHAYGQMLAKALAIDVKFIGAGGMRESMALLKVGKVDAGIFTFGAMANLIVAKEVRKLLSIEDYLPKDWLEHVIAVRRDLLRTEPETVKNALKSLIQGSNFIKGNRAWAIEMMKKEFGYKEEAARIAFEERLIMTINLGSLSGKAVENVRDFLLEYGIVSKERAPTAKAMYDRQVVEALAGGR